MDDTGRRPEAERPAVDAGAATLPGVGVDDKQAAKAATDSTAAPALLPIGGAPTIKPVAGNAANVGTLATEAPPGPRALVAQAETLAADPRGGGPDGPLAATLPGPHGVADLPALPPVDDSLYSIGAEIARGGMGKILAARDRRLRRDVVIKVTRRGDGRIDPRFEREALITARLQHPSIVRVYDAGVLGDGRAFYAMERVRGRSLDLVIAEATTLQKRLALLPHAIAVCDAIAYAHSEGVLHRDLKPSNVLVGPFGETVVIDWGLAKPFDAEELPPPEPSDPSEPGRSASGASRRATTDPARVGSSDNLALTEHGAVLGTPSYMAPEQARGEPSDERSDIYALGALLYTMLSGEPPHRGGSTDEMLARVAAGAHEPIRTREPNLPRELATLVERAMAPDRAARIASAKELADELRRFAAGKLLASHAYTLAQLVRRWLWRHRITVGVAAFALIVLALVGVLAVNNIVRERDIASAATTAAETERVKAARRYDDLVHDQARDALDSDPSRAVAWLKLMSADALGWPKTHELALEAARRGLAHELRGHAQDVELVEVSPDGKHVATASDDGTVRLWDLARLTSHELVGHTGPIDSITISRDGAQLATAGTDHDVWLWDLSSRVGRKLEGHHNTVRGVAFSPDGTRLASASEDGTLFVWETATGVGKKLFDYSHSLRPIVWIDGTTLITGAFNGMLGFYDATTGKGEMRPAHRAEIRCLALSPDRRHLAVGDEDGLVTLWTTDGTRVRTLGRHTDMVRVVKFTPDGTSVVSGGGDTHVLVHPVPAGAALELRGNLSGVKDLDISADGTLVASAGIDGTVRVWSITGTERHVFSGHGDAVKAVAFTRDGRVVSGSESDVARVWRLAEPEPPPVGAALRAWLARHTNVEVRAPRAPR